MDSEQPTQITSDTGLFVLIPEWVIDLEMSAGAFRLYAILGRYADWADGTAWPSRKTLANRLKASVDSTDRWLRELVEVGALEISRRIDKTPNATNRNLTNLYKIIRVAPLAPSRKDAPTPSRTVAPTPSRKDAALTITIFDHNQIRTTDVIERVFEAWIKSTGKDSTRTKLDSKRRARIKWAIDNYPEVDVLDAVVGWANSPFHSGKNAQRKIYNDITLLLRDAAHLEQMRDLARAPKQTAGLPAWQTLQNILESNE